jgi:hypothetical protein
MSRRESADGSVVGRSNIIPGREHFMAKSVGRSIPLSPFRRLVTDLMSFCQRIPAVTVDRRMDLADVTAARLQCPFRPPWCVLFAKAFALVARSHPEMRRTYMGFPWGRLYEHPSSTVSINVDRQLPEESVVVQCLIRRPENRSLSELAEIVRSYQDVPMEKLRWYRRAVTMSRVPWPIRRLLWWATLNIYGRRRCHNFGTFGVSSVGAQGAGLLHLLPILTSMLHYGLFDEAGRLDMRLTWDHRVMDGAAAARILVQVERTLQGEILDELTSMCHAKAA